MIATFALVAGGLLALFLIYVATRNGRFRYERSGLIQAPPEKIFPYISNLKLGSQWSPYERKDPKMKKSFSGPEDQPGGRMDFDGNKDVGSGSIQILKVIPNERVELRLQMLRPFKADNLVEYTLKTEMNGTRFTWAMSGEGGFFGKLIVVMIDCEKMVADEFSRGIENLKELIEKDRPNEPV
ncbi:MAG: SRPBCC family protein [Bdellovibrionaceae bacterium]|nr:SRPBCC family protein [Pseudobdellovibrionaceae bacterium]